ncbi:MAG: hypothetical protein U5L00_17705 [Desulfovermiculus sp.]|nr:hypothetical protein [Desulfovermiculus sp.]
MVCSELGIVGEQEADEAEIEIIHPEICKFQTEYFLIQAERNRFMVNSIAGPLEMVKDFVLKTFTDFLSHTPVGTLGINRAVHFDAGSNEARIALGQKLAPWEAWVSGQTLLTGKILRLRVVWSI